MHAAWAMAWARYACSMVPVNRCAPGPWAYTGTSSPPWVSYLGWHGDQKR